MVHSVDSANQVPWQPPSASLIRLEGVWHAPNIRDVSYPPEGSQHCLQVEASSYWFQHRNRCIVAAVAQFPSTGLIYDIGGGNGFVALALQNAGYDVALVEPGPGAMRAAARGLTRVVHASLEDTGFSPSTLPSAAAFDVIEHVKDDIDFLAMLHSFVMPGGRLYCTVPAIEALWSSEDEHAGHFRRYTRRSLRHALEHSGWQVEFLSPFFVWLTIPVGLFRALPSRLGLSRRAGPDAASMASDHHLPRSVAAMVARLHQWELQHIRDRRPLVTGTSLLCVARRTP